MSRSFARLARVAVASIVVSAMAIASAATAGCKPTVEGTSAVSKAGNGDANANANASADASASADAATNASAHDWGDAGINEKLGASPNLLELVPARIAVSSTVVNPHDFPEMIADGKMETAWNGRTGDLVGGYVAFRVPADARVKRIEMTAGYDRVKSGVDLFTANHRITKVAISREGVFLREVALDPKIRGLQSLPIDDAGGDYEVKVLETLPGSRKDWKELTVSELRVVGVPGRGRRVPNERLRVVVGKLDQEPNGMNTDYDLADVTAPGQPTFAAVCARYVKTLVDAKVEREEEAKTRGLKLSAPSCEEMPFAVPFTGDATYRQVKLARVSNGVATEARVVVELPRGWVVTPLGWSIDDPTDPGCPTIVRARRIEALRVENGHLLALLDGERGGMNADGKWAPWHVRDAQWCREVNGKLSCKWYMAQYRPELKHFAISPGGTLQLQGDSVPTE